MGVASERRLVRVAMAGGSFSPGASGVGSCACVVMGPAAAMTAEERRNRRRLIMVCGDCSGWGARSSEEDDEFRALVVGSLAMLELGFGWWVKEFRLKRVRL